MQGLENLTGQGLISPTQAPNPASSCRHGQEVLVEIMTRSADLFQILRQGPGLANRPNMIASLEERKSKIKETLLLIGDMFKRLKELEERSRPRARPTTPEADEQLLKMINERDVLVARIKEKNQEVKCIIDELRDIVWDVNTMLALPT